MALTFLVSMVAFTALYVFLLLERYALKQTAYDLDELHRRTA
jgi:hypothetical protein